MPNFFDMSRKAEPEDTLQVPLGGTRAQAMQRLQIGVTGVLLMLLMVALASVIQGRAAQSDATAVPQAAPTTEPSAPSKQNDPLVEAGVVPEMPSQPQATDAPPSRSGNAAEDAVAN